MLVTNAVPKNPPIFPEHVKCWDYSGPSLNLGKYLWVAQRRETKSSSSGLTNELHPA